MKLQAKVEVLIHFSDQPLPILALTHCPKDSGDNMSHLRTTVGHLGVTVVTFR